MKYKRSKSFTEDKLGENVTGKVITSGQKGTGGYDGAYGGGYASGSLAGQIRGGAPAGKYGGKIESVHLQSIYLQGEYTTIPPETQCKITANLPYFSFGAGVTVKTKTCSLCLPSAFFCKQQVYNQELIAFSADCSLEDREKSPVEVWLERMPLYKNMLVCDFFQQQHMQAYLTRRVSREVAANGAAACLTFEKNEQCPLIARVNILASAGNTIYCLKVFFHQEFSNSESVVRRIYTSLNIREQLK